MTSQINPTLLALARQYYSRAHALGVKGKKRDDGAIEYFVGAWAALDATDHPHASRIGQWSAMLLCTRGCAEITRIVAEHGPSAPATD